MDTKTKKMEKTKKSREAPSVKEQAADIMRSLLLTREAIRVVTERHREELAPLLAAREEAENSLLALLDQVGDNIKIRGIGTAYRRLETSATIGDGQAFRDYVIRSRAWELADWRANKTAVKEFIQKNKTVPPGVNFSQSWAVGLRADTSETPTE